jgi:hypothetical protein
MTHRLRSNHRISILPLLVLVSAGFPILAHSQCPESRVACAREELQAQGSTLRIECSGAQASLDLAAGNVTAEAWAAAGAASAVDRFEIVGIPASTPVAFTVRLLLDGHLTGAGPPNGWGAIMIAELEFSQHDQTSASRLILDSHLAPPSDIDHSLDLAVVATTGEPFTLSYRTEMLWADGPERSQVSGRLVFAGLPDGAGVRSCNGFAQSPVAVKPSTWQGVKLLFRPASSGLDPR